MASTAPSPPLTMTMTSSSEKKKEIFQKSLFFAICGGAVGAFAGGVIGLARGIPLTKSLPSSAFRTAALLGTVSAVQLALEHFRGTRDAWNPLLAGGWTGFIFGQSIGSARRDPRMGLAGAINGALLTWFLQSISVPRVVSVLSGTASALNPFAPSHYGSLYARITELKEEIASLKAQGNE